MQCEKCREKIATIHLTEIIKGIRSEVHLCEECAREIGLNSKLSNFSLSVSDMLSFLDADNCAVCDDISDNSVCSACSTAMPEITDNYIAGCQCCYSTFNKEIEEHLENNNIIPRHTGKVPINFKTVENFRKEEKCRDINVHHLQESLVKAVDSENYEEAAAIRDKIKELEQITSH